jgi:hypothetical protein
VPTNNGPGEPRGSARRCDMWNKFVPLTSSRAVRSSRRWDRDAAEFTFCSQHRQTGQLQSACAHPRVPRPPPLVIMKSRFPVNDRNGRLASHSRMGLSPPTVSTSRQPISNRSNAQSELAMHTPFVALSSVVVKDAYRAYTLQVVQRMVVGFVIRLWVRLKERYHFGSCRCLLLAQRSAPFARCTAP